MANVDIRNPQNSLLASDVLAELTQIVDSRQGIVEVSTSDSPGHKCEIITGLVLSVASSAVYELLKSIVMRFVQRKDFEGDTCLIVDGKRVELKELLSDEGARMP